uniref:Uncharacterized protein n=1 Tax=Oryza meridionalis TaxID=40149 RepID=A0A0E0DNE3_9ORYZ
MSEHGPREVGVLIPAASRRLSMTSTTRRTMPDSARKRSTAPNNAITLTLIKVNAMKVTAVVQQEKELEALSDQANRQRSLLPRHPRLHRATDQANGHLFTLQGTAGIATFIRDLRRVDWPADFKPTGIEKYGGKIDPESWLTIYTLAIRAVGGDSKAMANYLHVALTDSARSWPLGL